MNLENKQNRIGYIDFLKFIGLTGIIIAHVSSPTWLMALRSFDVPFMVIISSILGEKSYLKVTKNQISTFQYYINRFKRLVFPTWLFLLFYFSLYFILSGDLFELDYYIASFALTRYGIGYVWIILIYLYSALLIPLFAKIKLSKVGIICISTIYFLYEIAFYFQIGANSKLLNTTLYYIIPYGVLTYLGYNYCNIKKSYKYVIAILSFVVFLSFGIYYWNIYGTPQLVNISKYPPRVYYLAFGVAISFFLLIIFEKFQFKIYNNPFICFISKNSLWIYLWHILILTAYDYLRLPRMWIIELIVVYMSAIVIVYVVNKILDVVDKRRTLKIFKYLRG